jgi:hypothetical protein
VSPEGPPWIALIRTAIKALHQSAQAEATPWPYWQPAVSQLRSRCGVALGGFLMTRTDHVARWGRMGLVLVSLALVSGIVAEPLLRPLWSPHLTVAQR